MPGCPAWVAALGPYLAAVGLSIGSKALTASGHPALAQAMLAAWPLAAIWGKASCDTWAAVKPKGSPKEPRYKLQVNVPHG